MRERLRAGDILVLFPEGTSGDGRSVLPFKSSFFGAAEYPGVLVQPVSLAYRGHRNLPMDRRMLPSYAWYGDMDLAPHLLEALATGPVEVTVICHEPLSLWGESEPQGVWPATPRTEVRAGLVTSRFTIRPKWARSCPHGTLLQEGLRQDLRLPDECL